MSVRRFFRREKREDAPVGAREVDVDDDLEVGEEAGEVDGDSDEVRSEGTEVAAVRVVCEDGSQKTLEG